MRFDLVVNIMSAKAVTEGEVKVYGGEQWRPNVHARDAARGIVAGLLAPESAVAGEIFNVGSDAQNYRIQALGELVAARVPGTTVRIMGESPDPRSYRVSFEKIHRVLGFTPEKEVADGVDEIARLLREGGVADHREDRYYNVRYRYK
jgi:nucleoside-diphosphate-sugar epimerase